MDPSNKPLPSWSENRMAVHLSHILGHEHTGKCKAHDNRERVSTVMFEVHIRKQRIPPYCLLALCKSSTTSVQPSTRRIQVLTINLSKNTNAVKSLYPTSYETAVSACSCGKSPFGSVVSPPKHTFLPKPAKHKVRITPHEMSPSG